MRRYITLLFTLLTTTTLFAQQPWAELSSSQQSSVLVSRRVNGAMRRVMGGDIAISQLDRATRNEILERVTTRCNDANTAALYVYLYNLLREPDGSMSHSDVRMLTLHTAQMLAAWAANSEDDRYINYAYSLAKREAHFGKSATSGILKRLKKKRYAEYRDIATSLCKAVDIIALSEAAGVRTFEDITPPAQAEDRFLYLSGEDFAAVTATIKPLVDSLPAATSILEIEARDECIAWSGAYHTALKESIGRNTSLVRSTTPEAEYLTIIDSNDNSYTVENELYLLPSNHFVVVEQAKSPESLLLGRVMPRGGVEIIGRVYIDLGRKIRKLKCTADAIYLAVEGSRGVEYLMLPLK